MAYGHVNVPGVSELELKTVKETADAAKRASEGALKEITKLTKTIHAVPTQSGTLTYTGDAQQPQWSGYNAEMLDIGGILSSTDAGTYEVTFTPKKGYIWFDETDTAKTATWTIGRALVPSPTQSGALTYTGEVQQPQWSNYDADKMTIGGTTSGINAGSYNATFTPKANYKFVDGVGAKTVAWTINKAPGNMELSKSSLTIKAGMTSDIVTVTRSGDGILTAVSDAENIAAISVSGTTITITPKGSGNATITVKCAAGTNYEAPADKYINVTVRFADPLLENNSPETIKEIAQSGQAPNVWKVGDKVPIVIKGTVGALTINDTYYAFILGFNHNSGLEGNNSIHFQFGKNASGADIAFVDSDYRNYGSTAGFRMNTSNTNSGGWKDSYMRNTICPAFLAALPEDWQSVIVDCTKYSDNTGDGNDTASYVTATQDKIWLLAEYEAFGIRYYANIEEKNYQKQYDYYKNGNSKIKYKHNDTDTACFLWLRSVTTTNTYTFRIIDTDGTSAHNVASYSMGFAPGFKVA